MFLEIDQFAVNYDDWVWALSGNEEAKDRIKKAAHGVVLSCHAFPVQEGETLVTIRELQAVGILKSIELDTEN